MAIRKRPELGGKPVRWFNLELEEKTIFLDELNEKYKIRKNTTLVGALFGALAGLAIGGAITFTLGLFKDEIDEKTDEIEEEGKQDVVGDEKSWWQRFFGDEEMPPSDREVEVTTSPSSDVDLTTPDDENAGSPKDKQTTRQPSRTRSSHARAQPSDGARIAKKWQQTASYGQAAKGLPGAIQAASKATGVSPSILYAFAFKETRFGKIMNNTTSSAQGVFQFLPRTWKEIENKYSKQFPVLKMGPKNIRAAALGAALMIKGLIRTYTRNFAGNPSATDLYMMYLLGPTGGTRFLKAMENNPEASAPRTFPREAKANPSVFYQAGRARTLGGVYRYMDEEIGEVEEALRPTNKGNVSSPNSDSEGANKGASIVPIPETVPSVAYNAPRLSDPKIDFDAQRNNVTETSPERGSDNPVGPSRPQEFIEHDGQVVAVS